MSNTKHVFGRPRPDDNEGNSTILWAHIHHLEAMLKGPDGFDTWQDAAIDERRTRRQATDEIKSLRETNRKLHRRLQTAEAPVEKLEEHAKRMSDQWLFEFNRLGIAYGEIKAIFLELARVVKYPQDGLSMHSVMDSSRKKGIWASCFLSEKGGSEEYRVLDEVSKVVRRLEVAESLLSKDRDEMS